MKIMDSSNGIFINLEILITSQIAKLVTSFKDMRR